MKKVLFILLSSLLPFLGTTQQNDISNRVNSADLVAEGEVVGKTSFWGHGKKQIFTTYHIKVGKSFKGSVTDGKFEIITMGGQVADQFQVVFHQSVLKVGMKGMFFCQKSKSPGPKVVINAASYSILPESGFIQYHQEQFNPPASDGNKTYKSIQKEIYDKIILTTRSPIKLFASLGGQVQLQNKEEDSPNVTIFYSFENVTLTAGYEKIVFDIYAHASHNGVKFGRARVLLNYNSEVFGANAVGLGNVEVSKGTIIQNPVYDILSEDVNSERLRFRILSPGISPDDAYELTTVPERFCHVELRIADPTALANISFDDFGMAASSWYLDERTGNYTPFDDIDTGEPIEGGEDPNELVLIDYEFNNICVTDSSGIKYLEFDIDAHANVGWTRLAVARPIIGFNPDGFGQAPVLSGNFTHTIAPALKSLGYSSFQNDLAGLIDLNIYQNSSDSTDYLVLPTTPTNIAHCKFKIQDCNVKAGLYFSVEYMSQLFPSYYYSDSIIAYIEYLYGEDALLSFYDQYLCRDSTPIITSVSPDDLRAGVFEVLTVKGKNLKMSDTENGTFYFRDSESPNDMVFYAAYSTDVITWTDTLIEIYVPSDLATGPGSAASGKIRVTNAAGKQAESDDEIFVQYSVTNIRDADFEAHRISLIDANGSGGYTFKMDDELGNFYPDDCIGRALDAWRCVTNINWELSSSGIFGLDSSDVDDNSTIIIGDTISGAPLGYASVAGHTKECDSGMSINGYYVDDVDIVINRYTNNGYDCDSTYANVNEDFYVTLVHELGHTHMLLHTVQDADAVYTHSTVRSPSGADIAGGLDVMAWSSGWTTGGDCPDAHIPNPCSTNTDETHTEGLLYPKVYPNPVEQLIIIDWSAVISPPSRYKTVIYDITGKTKYIKEYEQSPDKAEKLQLSSLEKGLYIITIYTDSKTISYKLIKR